MICNRCVACYICTYTCKMSLCTYRCLHVYIYNVCVYIYMNICTYVESCRIRAHTHACGYRHTSTCVHVSLCTCMCTNFSTSPETRREAHLVQGMASLPAVAPSVAQGSPTASACSLGNSAQSLCSGKVIPSTKSARTCLCTKDTSLPGCYEGRQEQRCSQLSDVLWSPAE